MSGECTVWAWRQELPSATIRLVLLALADMANRDGYCWPSQRYLAVKTGLSERAVRASMKTLEESGFINRLASYSGKFRGSDLIHLSLTETTIFEGQARGDEAPAHPGIPLPERRAAIDRHQKTVGAAPRAGEPSIEPHPPSSAYRAGHSPRRTCPDNWAILDSHRAKAAEFGWPEGMLDEEAERFRLWEFRDPKTDFNRAFHRWMGMTQEDRVKKGAVRAVATVYEPGHPPLASAPPIWAVTQAHRDKASSLGWPDGMLEEQAEHFRAWEYRRPKTDFNLAFMTWILKTHEDRTKDGTAGNGTSPGGGPQPRSERIGAMHRGALAALDRFQRERGPGDPDDFPV